MSASASQANPNTTTVSQQQSTQGAAGANSPTTTVSAGGGVSYNDPGLQLATVQSLATIVQQALEAAGKAVNTSQGTIQDLSSNAQQNLAAQNSDQNSLLQSVLASESQLAQAQGTGGASLSYNTNNYLIAAGAVLAAIFLFRKKS